MPPAKYVAPEIPPWFRHAHARCRIGSLDDTRISVAAQYNPRELVVTQPIGWTEHKPIANQKPDAMYLDFGGMQPQTVQVELLFDGAENQGRIAQDAASATVMDAITLLQRLAAVRDPHATDEEKRRPHFCVVSWGNDMPPFEGVIESLVVKYQVWDSDGTVLRATVTLAMKQASRVGIAEKERPKNRVRPT